MQLVASLFFFSRKIILSRNSRNARKRRGCAGVPFGIYIAHKFHECLSLRDRFFSHRLHRFYRFFILIIRFALLLCKNRSADLHRFYRCAMVFLDVLEELGRCAALDFVILVFRQNATKTNFLFLHTPRYVCDVSWRKNDRPFGIKKMRRNA